MSQIYSHFFLILADVCQLLILTCYLLGPLLINANISLKALIDAAIAGSLNYNKGSLKLTVGNEESNKTFQETMQIYQFKDHKL